MKYLTMFHVIPQVFRSLESPKSLRWPIVSRSSCVCVNNFPFLIFSWKIQGQLLQVSVWSIYIVRGILIVKFIALPPPCGRELPPGFYVSCFCSCYACFFVLHCICTCMSLCCFHVHACPVSLWFSLILHCLLKVFDV